MRSRRRFLREFATLSAGAIVVPAIGTGAVLASEVAPRSLDLDLFAGLINQTFRTDSADRPRIPLVLKTAERLPCAHGEQFVLNFQGPKDVLPGQNTYWFEHKRTGRFPIFIVPATASGADTSSYVAVFNHLAGSKPADPAGDHTLLQAEG